MVKNCAGICHTGSPGNSAEQLCGIGCPVRISVMTLETGQLVSSAPMSVTGTPELCGNTIFVSEFLEIKVNG